MCTRSTPGSVTYDKNEGSPTVQYIKVSSTGAFILKDTLSLPLLTDIEGSQFQHQQQLQGKTILNY